MKPVALPLDVITNFEFCNNYSIFAIANDNAMTTKLIRIGNSRGIVIPAKLLKKYGADDSTMVSLEEEDGRLYLAFSKEEPFTGPFTGPFKVFSGDPEAWGGDMDPLEYARILHDSRVNTREIPDW